MSSGWMIKGIDFSSLFEYNSSKSLKTKILNDNTGVTSVTFIGSIGGQEASIGDFELTGGSKYGNAAGNLKGNVVGRYRLLDGGNTIDINFDLSRATVAGSAPTIPVGDNLEPSTTLSTVNALYGSATSSGYSEGYSGRFSSGNGTPTSYSISRSTSPSSNRISNSVSIDSNGNSNITFTLSASAEVGNHTETAVVTVYGTNTAGTSSITSRRKITANFTVIAGTPVGAGASQSSLDSLYDADKGIKSETVRYNLDSFFTANSNIPLTYSRVGYGGTIPTGFTFKAADNILSGSRNETLDVRLNFDTDVPSTWGGTFSANVYSRITASNGVNTSASVKFRHLWKVTVNDNGTSV